MYECVHVTYNVVGELKTYFASFRPPRPKKASNQVSRNRLTGGMKIVNNALTILEDKTLYQEIWQSLPG